MTREISYLLGAGYEPTSGGSVILSGPAAALHRQWSNFLARTFRPYYSHFFNAPVFIEESVLEAANYLEHFPQQPVVAQGYIDRSPTRKFLAPAACLHLYPRLRGEALGGNLFSAFIEAHCARYEGGEWEFPFRTSDFHMAELVVIGQESQVDSLYHEVQSFMLTMFEQLGVKGEQRVASDAFFLESSEGARIIQKLKELKKEYTVLLSTTPDSQHSTPNTLPLASLNKHEVYFSQRFGIGAPGEPPPHSFCLAFGIERLTAYGLLLWGSDETCWPEGLRP